MKRMTWAVALIAAAGSGCWVRDAVARDVDLPAIRTDSAAYTLRRVGTGVQGAIDFTFTNHTGGDVFADGCGGPYPPKLERLVGGEWVLAYAPLVPLCSSPPVRIGAGASCRSTLHIAARRTGTRLSPRWERGLGPGTYRLVWDALSAPAELRVSNSFTLRVE